MTERNNQPKPDDRTDNVDKLQDMVQNTIENLEESHETKQFASSEEKEKIKEKNRRREESISGMRAEIKDEARDQQ